MAAEKEDNQAQIAQTMAENRGNMNNINEQTEKENVQGDGINVKKQNDRTIFYTEPLATICRCRGCIN